MLTGVDSDGFVADARRHIQSCGPCQERLRVIESQHRVLSNLQSRAVAPQPGCPPEDVVRRLSAGMLAAPAAEEVVRHSSICDYCGKLLREFRADFTDQLTPQEDRLLGTLRSAEPEWQRRLATDLARAGRRPQRESWFARL